MATKNFGAEDIYWKDKKRTYALGRNGWMFCIGVNIYHYKPHTANDTVEEVELSPINSKNNSGRCHIRIPVSELPGIIEELEKIYQQETFFE